SVKNQGQSDIELVFDYQEMKTDQNTFGDDLDKKNVKDIEEGFCFTYKLLMSRRKDYIETIKTLFSDVQIRVILKSTAVYSTLLGLLYHPDILMDSLSQRIILCKDY